MPFGQRGSVSSQKEYLVSGPGPGPEEAITAYEFIAASHQSALRQPRSSQVEIPTTYEFDDSNCPFNQETLHSFPSIEPSKCYCCGLKLSKNILKKGKSDFPQPCEACRTGGPNSHLRAGSDRGRRASAQSILPQRRNRSTSADQPIRLVPATEAARRLANRPTRARVPRDLLPRVQDPVVRDTISPPKSPKLHHVHGLPGWKDHPYVHKHEVEQHLAALRAGSPSPLREIAELSRALTYNAPVFYPGPKSSVGPRRSVAGPSSSPPHSRPSTAQRTRKKEGRKALRTYGAPAFEQELENSRVYQRHAPQPRQKSPLQYELTPTPSISASDSSDSDSTDRVGGIRLELRGGCGFATSRLRGGCGDHVVSGRRRFKLKSWLLTGSCFSRACHVDSDNDLPPVRIATPSKALRARQANGKKVPLPSYIAKRVSPTTSSGTSSQLPANGTSNSAPTHCAQAPTTAPLPTTVSLRGGAGSPSTLLDTDRLPPTLFWLAGGMGKPITVRAWKKVRPKMRDATWFGLMAFGRRAGTRYAGGCEEGGGGGKEGEGAAGECGGGKESDAAGSKEDGSAEESAEKESAEKESAEKESAEKAGTSMT
ncbi:hypothetical protein IQ07DRAFT_603365 [Pyrenochaeta sp. DS3sAY3a]|nr:hypothetical protein IQ07DRAFT_603365 [Pyrenochaeta sp. DS3sAY3a]